MCRARHQDPDMFELVERPANAVKGHHIGPSLSQLTGAKATGGPGVLI